VKIPKILPLERLPAVILRVVLEGQADLEVPEVFNLPSL
jgi:hypothetical protein